MCNLKYKSQKFFREISANRNKCVYGKYTALGFGINRNVRVY